MYPGNVDMETSKRKILVIDDNLEFTQIVAWNLEKQGFHVSVASNGNAAIERVISESPDLVLLDLRLPDMGGEEVLKRIKAINEDTAIVIITGYGGEQIAVDLMKAGATDFLSKPVERETLIRAVRNALKVRDSQMEEKQSESHPSLEKFFPFLAHEIRNPLHAVGGALAIIQRRCDLKDELLNQSIKIIQEEVRHLNEFVQECLDFVRPPAKSRFIDVNVNEVISVVINIMSHMFEELSGKIRIAMEMDPQLPEIKANYDELKQAFLNIVKNCFEAMPEGGELIIKTSLRSNSNPKCVEITFADHGLGIKEGNLKRLFQPFFTTKLRGTGLGLAICRRIIVERHNGRIDVESEEGRGTTVIVQLPAKLATKTLENG